MLSAIVDLVEGFAGFGVGSKVNTEKEAWVVAVPSGVAG
jgi:hypothetical protein